MFADTKDPFKQITVKNAHIISESASKPSARQNLAGGSGAFSQFFEDMAYSDLNPIEPCSRLEGRYDRFGRKKKLNVKLPSRTRDCDDNSDAKKFHEFYAQTDIESDIVFDDIYPNIYEEDSGFYPFPDHANASGSKKNYSFSSTNNIFITHDQVRKPAKVLINRFLLGKTIGRGSYGKVKDCLDLVTLRREAAKIVTKQGVRKIPGGWTQALHEAVIFRNLIPHPNIVRVVTTLRFADPERICIIMENCLGSIHDLQSAGVPMGYSSSLVEDNVDHSDPNTMNLLDRDSIYSSISTRDIDRRLSIQRISTEPLLTDSDNLTQTKISGLLSCEIGRNVVNNEINSRKVSNIDFPNRGTRVHRNSSPGAPQQFRRLPEAQAHAYFLQILNAISFLHSKRIIHRDIKPGNMLLVAAPGCGVDPTGYNAFQSTSISNSLFFDSTENHWSFSDVMRLSRGYLVKLTDFGVSASLAFDEKQELVTGGQMTPAIQPPEVAQGQASLFHGPKLDIYSAGVSLFFMLVGRVPFSSQNVLKMFDIIAKGKYIIPGHVSVNASEIIRGMMQKDPEKRFSLTEVAQHKWLQETPRSHPTVRQAVEYCHRFWSQNASSSQPHNRKRKFPRGSPIWLDPLVYLTRPTPNFSEPHIDEAGARIFSESECVILMGQSKMNDSETSSCGPVLQLEEWSKKLWLSKEVAPMSVIPRLKAYLNWPPSPDSEQEGSRDPSDPIRSLFSGAFMNPGFAPSLVLSDHLDSKTASHNGLDGFADNSNSHENRLATKLEALRVSCNMPILEGLEVDSESYNLPEKRVTSSVSPNYVDGQRSSCRNRVLSSNFISEHSSPVGVAAYPQEGDLDLPMMHQNSALHHRTFSLSAWSKVTCDAPRQRHFSLADTQGNEVIATAAAASQMLHAPECPDDIPIIDTSDKQSSSVLTLNSLTAPQLVKLASLMDQNSSSTVALGVRASESSLSSGIGTTGTYHGRTNTSNKSLNSQSISSQLWNPPINRNSDHSTRCSFQIGDEEEEEEEDSTEKPIGSSKVHSTKRLELKAPEHSNSHKSIGTKSGRRLTSLFLSVGKRLQNSLSIKRSSSHVEDVHLSGLNSSNSIRSVQHTDPKNKEEKNSTTREPLFKKYLDSMKRSGHN